MDDDARHGCSFNLLTLGNPCRRCLGMDAPCWAGQGKAKRCNLQLLLRPHSSPIAVTMRALIFAEEVGGRQGGEGRERDGWMESEARIARVLTILLLLSGSLELSRSAKTRLGWAGLDWTGLIRGVGCSNSPYNTTGEGKWVEVIEQRVSKMRL